MSLKPAKTGRKITQAGGTAPVILPRLMWGVAILMVAVAVYVAINRVPVVFSQTLGSQNPTPALAPTPTEDAPAALPDLAPTRQQAVSRASELHTNIPQRPNVEGQEYTIEAGDSIFAISEYFKIKPETILWANYSVLNDNPDMLALGQRLYIPPTDGVVHKWKEGDTFEDVARQYKANVKDILLWPGNKLDIVTPEAQVGAMVMVPNGQREFRRTWVVPTIPRGAAGVAIDLPGACDTGTGGAMGTGSFIWPGPVHKLSGNDYWSGHLAIDIAIGIGTPVVAADAGVVVFSGSTSVGYGNMVMIDHGNGFQTLYAHLSAALVRCGQSVNKGVTIGTGGSTGNSTGPHLHFEMRYMGGFVNPKAYLR